eukprot:3481663-Amphidinium_carterae.1
MVAGKEPEWSYCKGSQLDCYSIREPQRPHTKEQYSYNCESSVLGKPPKLTKNDGKIKQQK